MSRSAELKYNEKKEELLSQFRKNLQDVSNIEGAFSLNKKTSNLFRNRKAGSSKKLDVRHLTEVLSIDPLNKIASVEAMITYEDLVEETLKYGLLPAVVPQLKTITVGGALVGLGIESSSFKYGLVHETILEVEILTGLGHVVVATPDNLEKDLFYALPNSYGTLGYALKIKLKLIEAKPFIKLTHLRFNDPKIYFETLEKFCKERRAESVDSYVDGVIFSPKEMVISIGEGLKEVPYISNYTYMSIFYESLLQKKTDFLTIKDYIWRWDTDWFWCSKHFGMHNRLLRFLLGKWMLHSSVYWKIKHLAGTNRWVKALIRLFEKPSESVIQDILIPIENALPFYEFMKNSIGIWPIWICPSQFYNNQKSYPFCPMLKPSDLYLDFGFWDILPSNQPKGFFNQLIEKKCDELSGFKSLYSDSFYTEKEFWEMYPKTDFKELKRKYDPKNVFNDLYEKCVQRR